MKKRQLITKSLSVIVLVASLTVFVPNLGQATENTDDIPFDIVIKAKGLSTLYYYTSEGKRLVFPNEATYKSWFDDFADIIEMAMEKISQIPLAGNVRYRPGVVMVKITTDPKVYAVSQNGVLRWIRTEKLAKKLYGDNWNLLIDDVPDCFFVNYTIGPDIDDEDDYEPDEEVDNNTTINHNRKLKKIAKQARKANTFRCRAVPAVPAHKQGKTGRATPAIPARWCAHAKHGVDDDETAPVISDIDVVESALSAVVSWTTDEVSDSYVKYATSTLSIASTTDTVKNVNLVTSHSLTLSNLEPDTIYYFQITSADAHNNQATSTEQTFTTLEQEDTAAPVISNISVTPYATSTLITWTTDEASTSKAEYATSTLSSATTNLSVEDTSLVTSHSLTLINLEPETTYYFILTSADASNNQATSTEQLFTTTAEPDTTPPVISDMSVTPYATSSLVSWTTDEDSDSLVKYATSTLSAASYIESVGDSSFVTSHQITLDGLTASTTYYFIIESTDADDNKAVAEEDSFITLVE